jgi:predicted ATPase
MQKPASSSLWRTKKGASIWKAGGMMLQGVLTALSGKAPDAVNMLNVANTAVRSTGATLFAPWSLSFLARGHAELGEFDHAACTISEAIRSVKITGERWHEVDVYRMAGDVALISPELDDKKAEAYFARALATAREQQAKSRELRAAISLARLWRDRGKRNDGRSKYVWPCVRI